MLLLKLEVVSFNKIPYQTNPTVQYLNEMSHTHTKFPPLARTGSFVARAILCLLGGRVDLPAD